VLDRILTFSVSHRYFVVLLAFSAACAWLVSLTRLSIDAVPDITNKQVQITTLFTEFGKRQSTVERVPARADRGQSCTRCRLNKRRGMS
jgi:Cu/Ag efflux pump CusA